VKFFRFSSLLVLASFLPVTVNGFTLPDLDPIPAYPAPQALGSVTMGDPANFAEVKMDFPIESGPFEPTWSSIIANYPTRDSAWLRQAKFGIWVHFGPQSAGQSGDWYARRMYIEGEAAYNNHIRDFGHPTTVGYKDLIRTWNPTALDPAALTQTYHDAGARFLMVQGVHHDQYDNWNSRYQPWNSVNLGAHRDFLGEWRDAVRSHADMRFGVTFHHEYSWWWWQSCYRADTTNAQGQLNVPYDGNLTTNYDGTGQWWGTSPFDLRKLYLLNLREYAGIYNAMDKTGYNLSKGIFVNHLEYAHWYATWWALRIEDVIENYDPDFIYTDGNSTQPFSGYASGSGYKCDAMQRVLAHYFNRTLERRGMLDTFGIVKFNPNNRGIVNTFESTYPSAIKTNQPWIGEVPVGDWFYNTGFNYNPNIIIRYLLECVSRDGAAAVCIALRPDGSLDPGSVTQLQGVGNWMNINSAGIYGSRAWNLYGEGANKLPTGNLGSSQANATFTTADFRYTVGADGYLYAYCLKVPAGGEQLKLTVLGTGDGNLAAPITSVELLGNNATLTWSQTATDLNITCPASMPFQTAVCFKIGPTSIVRPPTPTDVFAQSSTSGVALRWSSPLVSATFTVKRATSPSGPFTDLATDLTAQSYADTSVQAGSIYYYLVTATQNGVTSTNSAIAPGILAGAATWQSQDIGTVGASGAFAKSGGRVILSGSGADIWYAADGFRYAYRKLDGDGSIIVRVMSQQNTAPWAKAGVMIRESLNANSRYVLAYMSPSNGTALQQRATTGGNASGVSGSAGLTTPYWLRLTRSGNTFTASQSADGTNWTTLGTSSVTMATSVNVGLAACSVSDGTLMQAAFDQVAVTGQTSPEAPDSLTATASDGKVDLSWSASTGAASYTVQRATTSGGPYTDVVAGLTGTSHTDSTLTNGTTYFYVVTATNTAGTSGPTPEATARPLDAKQAWRLAHFGTIDNSGDAADSADPDGDGMTNAQEFGAGTDPNNHSSVLVVSSVTIGGQDVIVTFPSIAGKKYRAERSVTLQSSSWTTIRDNIPGTGDPIQVTDAGAAAQSKRFYRVVIVP
jgi:alpha-L-fucosidase